MSSRRLCTLIAVIALALGLTPLAGTADDGVETTGDIEKVGGLEYQGGTETAFDGRYIYAGQFNGADDRGQIPDQGGFFVIDMVGDDPDDPDITDPVEQFELVGKLDCAGTDNYVKVLPEEVYGPDLVVVGHHENECNRNLPGTPRGTGGQGMLVIDVSDKTNPTPVAGVGRIPSVHTLAVHPTKPYVYTLPGGTANGNGVVGIIDMSDPLEPRVVNEWQSSAVGCHDGDFFQDGSDLMYCAGLGEVQIWDVSDVENPTTVSTIVNPAIQFPHFALASPDSNYLVINDEAFAAHECDTGTSLTGSLWIYDISEPELPILSGRIAPPESRASVGTLPGWTESWCAAHNYNFVPGTNLLVASWFTGGTTVHDISDPLFPEELATYKPDDGIAYTAHYYGGYVVTNDMLRGTEILDMPALREAEQAAAELTEAERLAAAEERAAVTRARGDVSDILLDPFLAVLDALPDRQSQVGQRGGVCMLPASPQGLGAGTLGGNVRIIDRR